MLPLFILLYCIVEIFHKKSQKSINNITNLLHFLSSTSFFEFSDSTFILLFFFYTRIPWLTVNAVLPNETHSSTHLYFATMLLGVLASNTSLECRPTGFEGTPLKTKLNFWLVRLKVSLSGVLPLFSRGCLGFMVFFNILNATPPSFTLTPTHKNILWSLLDFNNLC